MAKLCSTTDVVGASMNSGSEIALGVVVHDDG
jgi:hypothetical protein